MSLATSEPQEPKFLARFEHVWASLRRYQVRQGLCLVVPGRRRSAWPCWWRPISGWSCPGTRAAAGLVAVRGRDTGGPLGPVIAPLRWWTKPRTAVEIETPVPAARPADPNRRPVRRAFRRDDPLRRRDAEPCGGPGSKRPRSRCNRCRSIGVVPWRRVWAVAALAAVPLLFLLDRSGAATPEWRIALDRALLSRRPYTTLSRRAGERHGRPG